MGEEMKKQNSWKIVLLMLCGVLINILGKNVALMLHLPLWMDALGTGVIAAVLGPVYGAVGGACTNLICAMFKPVYGIYALTSIAIGIVMGICMKRGMLEHRFTAMTTAVIVAFVASAISTPINFMFMEDMTGNIWGDALYGMLLSVGCYKILASILAEFFVNFPDKVVMVFATYLLLKIPLLREMKRETMRRMGMFSAVCICILLSALTGSQKVAGQEISEADMEDLAAQYTQTIYNSDNGLTAGEANAIVETEDGYVWIGTYAGLYRYDGHNFTQMNFDSVKNVNCLYVDDEGRLWIGTNDKGISLYQKGSIVSVLGKENGLPSNSIRSIVEGEDGEYYVGTSAMLCRIAEDEGLRVDETYSEVIYANKLAVSSDGIVAAVTNAGELVFLEDQNVEGIYTLEGDGVYYTSCSFEAEDTLLVATSSNLILEWDFTQNEPKMEQAISTGEFAYIHSLSMEDNGLIWVCTDNGIGYLWNQKFYSVVTGNFNGSIDDMMKDYQGNLWFTSSRLGVLKMSRNSFQNIYEQCGMADKVVNSVTMWKGLLYSGTDAGLDIIDPETKEAVQNELTEKMSNNRVRCVRVDSKNHLWIATSGGIGLVEVSEDGSVQTYSTDQGTVGDRFRSIVELSDGTMAAAENTGIDFIKDGKVLSTLGLEDGLTNPQILSLIETEDGTLYAGSDGEGIMVIRDRKVVDQITEEDGLPSGVILRMVAIDEGYLVVTSNSLCYMDAQENVKEIKEFPYSNNYDVVDAGDGNLWILGSAGIYIVDKDTLLQDGEMTTELLDSRKGLKSSLTANSWNYQEGKTLYLSCSTGVYSIDMQNYAVYTGAYRMMLDYVDSDNVSCQIVEDGVTNIANDTTRIRIRPELLNYTLNDPYISYYMEGVDDQETVVQQSELTDVTYTNLPAGTYVFHVAVLDNTGSEVIEQHVYTLEKQPQFWEHGWFIVYLILVCVLGIMYVTWLIAVLHTNKIIERQKNELEFARKQAEMGNQTILAIAKAVDAKDGNTSQHSARVAEYSVMLAKRLGWSEEQCENLRQIALLHDIGKIGIPDSILNKPDRLTDEEYAVMKSHVVIGAKILKDFTLVENVADGVRYHHERYDGSGYVEGLKGENIPLDARIIGIADAYDAMTSNRVYRDHLDQETVIRELKKGSGTQFDPVLVELFLQMLQEGIKCNL